MASLHNLFFAIRPDDGAADRIVGLAEELRRRHGMAGRPIARDRLHMSLNPLVWKGERLEATVETACAAAATVQARPFVVALDRVASFKHPDQRPLVLMGEDGVIGALALFASIHVALTRAGLAKGRARTIEPHVTLLRDRAPAPDAFVDPVAWRVREFVLVDSRVGEGRHEVLGRWVLDPRSN